MGPHNKGTRVNWDEDPSLTLRLLNHIASNPRYRSCLFGSSNPGERWTAERDLCIEMLGDQAWMQDKAEKGWVVRKGGRWVPTEAWTSGVMHPVRNRLSVLVKRMDSGWYETKYVLDPRWNSERDIPWDRQANFAQSCPYYFTLRQLWRESKASKSLPPLPTSAESSSMAQGKRSAGDLYESIPKRARNDQTYMPQNQQGMISQAVYGGMPVYGAPAQYPGPIVKRGRGRPPGTGKNQSTTARDGEMMKGGAQALGSRMNGMVMGQLVGFGGADGISPMPMVQSVAVEKRGRGRPPGPGKRKAPQ
ncbi:hypothetical protein IAR55_006970 [Kwoniella newhampshirensis]|uniref:Uncharacterized protein n=1 Tax=Kwoniella newhampshirensis TaxID=1651941 RepID=A0AAW0YCT3_9TREE